MAKTDKTAAEKAARLIEQGRATLGIELGSTRIKAVLIDENCRPLATSAHTWENRLENGFWTYSLDDVWAGLQDAFAGLRETVFANYGVRLETLGGLGISAMMHGYLPFAADGRLLAPFRTWRNTNTEQAAAALSAAFEYNIPLRWSIAHLYQAMLDREPHVKDVAFLTTLAGYVHWRLSGEKVLGIGDASGMFPIDNHTRAYHTHMQQTFEEMAAAQDCPVRLAAILPTVLVAGQNAGALTGEGARLLDPTGTLKPGVPLCPPEGDAGTGMVATNSVAQRTGNVSAGTSIFAMIVLEKELSQVYPEIDMVTTPTGEPVAMVHCNSCTSDLDAWAGLFGEVLEAMGTKVSRAALYDMLYNKAMQAQPDAGGLVSFNYYAGEPITGLEDGRPLLARLPGSPLTLANFMRATLFSAMATLRIGIDILTEREGVKLGRILGHGGLFKTKDVGQQLMAAALKVPVAVMESAAEGGAWGIALLSAYRQNCENGETLECYLAEKVFKRAAVSQAEPQPSDVKGFEDFMARYKSALPVEKAAVGCLK